MTLASSFDRRPGGVQCLISFGSNLGTRETIIAEAARLIATSELAGEFSTSRLFETPPIGGPGGQEPFLNAIAAIETDASANQVLALLQKTETELGRRRRRRWDARSIDLDVVLHGSLVGGGSDLTVPHPRYTARQFVLKPACDVAAHFRDPRFNWTLEQLAQHLAAGVPSLALEGGDQQTRELLCRRLSDEFGIRTFAGQPMGEPMTVVANAPAPRTEPAHRVAAPVLPPSNEPWISSFVPSLPAAPKATAMASQPADSVSWSADPAPRLIARMQRATPATRWPAPHQIWPKCGWNWPEYRLEIDDLDWAVRELASALDSMACPVEPITADGDWWR